MVCGLSNVGRMCKLNMAAYNFLRMCSLGQVHLQGVG